MQCHGLQCGFCTPGMLITARALLDREPDPDEDTIREAISGQICRCTGYTTIVRSIQWAARRRNGREDFAPEAQTDETMGGDAAEHADRSGEPVMTTVSGPASRRTIWPTTTLAGGGTAGCCVRRTPDSSVAGAPSSTICSRPGMLHMAILRSPHRTRADP